MTLSELLVTYTTSQVSSQILTSLAGQDPPLPTTSWQSGSVPQILVSSFSTTAADLYAGRYAVASGGYLGTATGDWLSLLAEENYGTARIEAVTTKGFILFTNAGSSPASITANTTTVGVSTKAYRALVSGTVPAGGALYLPVEAVEAGASGNVANGSIISMITVVAGVTVSNPIPWITVSGDSAVYTRGYLTVSSTTGGVLLSGASFSDGGTHTYTSLEGVTLAAGGSAEILVEADGFGSEYNIAPTTLDTVVSSSIVDLTCSNDPATDNLSTWIYRAGSDTESDVSLRTRARNVLLARGIVWTQAGITDQLQQCVLTSGTVVSRVQVGTSVDSTGVVVCYAASSAGALLSGDLLELQTWMDDRRALGSQIYVYSAQDKAITITATITVPAGFLSTAQAEVAETLAALAANTPVGGDDRTGNNLLREDIVAALKRNRYDSTGAQVNPSAALAVTLTAPASDVSLSTVYVPVFTTNLTWVEA